MARSKKALLAGLAGAALLLAAVAAGAAAPEKIDRSVAAPRDGTVSISNVSGSVRVEGWGEARVTVTGRLGRGSERLDVGNAGQRTEVKVVLPRHAHDVEGSDLVVRVPNGSRVEVEVVSASLEVGDVQGALDLQSVSGDVTARGAAREMAIKTVSGNIVIEAATPELTVETVSGDIRAEGLRGSLEISTVSGDANLKASGEIRRLRFSAVSGNLICACPLAADASVEAESHSGDIALTVGDHPQGAFSLSSFSGGITNEFGTGAARSKPYSRDDDATNVSKEMKFTLGDAPARVEITTFSGDIALRAK